MGNCFSKNAELSVGTSNEALTHNYENHVVENKSPKKEIKDIVVKIILLGN